MTTVKKILIFFCVFVVVLNADEAQAIMKKVDNNMRGKKCLSEVKDEYYIPWA